MFHGIKSVLDYSRREGSKRIVRVFFVGCSIEFLGGGCSDYSTGQYVSTIPFPKIQRNWYGTAYKLSQLVVIVTHTQTETTKKRGGFSSLELVSREDMGIPLH
jgi:hypothetical protein